MPDHLFPRIHVRPPTGFVNDPNGPVLIGGRYHLYFQYCSSTAKQAPVGWGHVSSSDLVRWRDHPMALQPSPDGPDRDGAWSGNVIRWDGELVAFYSGYRDDHPFQSIVTATSRDGGESFGPPSRVVADPGAGEGVLHFRDPFVWRDGAVWRLVVGAGHQSGAASARLYESPDGKRWRFRGDLTRMPRTMTPYGDTGSMWECPQVLGFAEGDALLVSSWSPDEPLGRTLVITGRIRDGVMAEQRLSALDEGPSFYAASALRDEQVVWGWVTEARSAAWAEEDDWSGMLSLPRRVRWDPAGRLASSPVPGMEQLRGAPLEAERVGAGTQVRAVPAQFELEASSTGVARLTMAFSATERVTISLDAVTRSVDVDATAASADARAAGTRFAFDEPGDPGDEISVRLFVDGSVAELFTASGRVATFRLYPLAPPPWAVRYDGAGSLTGWPLHGART